jgi:hypothetical protein|tara:strand:+ start:193 stop:516 length:324 start_codon:yes stop_codon:yes gene_type:complete
MIILFIVVWLILVFLILRFFSVSSTPVYSPFELVEEGYPVEECHRCGKTNILKEDVTSWEDEGFLHDYADALFCESCFNDKDRHGQPYLSDVDEMRANPHNYLPRGY